MRSHPIANLKKCVDEAAIAQNLLGCYPPAIACIKQQLARLSWDRGKGAQRLCSFGLDTLKQLVRMK